MAEKVKVPKVFAEWLEKYSVTDIDTTKGRQERIEAISEIYCRLMWHIQTAEMEEHEAINEWIGKNFETAVRAVLDSYEVEEPKREFKLSNGQYLGRDSRRHFVSFPMFSIEVSDSFVELNSGELDTAQQYLNGEVVTEEGE